MGWKWSTKSALLVEHGRNQWCVLKSIEQNERQHKGLGAMVQCGEAGLAAVQQAGTAGPTQRQATWGSDNPGVPACPDVVLPARVWLRVMHGLIDEALLRCSFLGQCETHVQATLMRPFWGTSSLIVKVIHGLTDEALLRFPFFGLSEGQTWGPLEVHCWLLTSRAWLLGPYFGAFSLAIVWEPGMAWLLRPCWGSPRQVC